ncbi:17022_t:CDS:2, partial [Gigaspora margarita]
NREMPVQGTPNIYREHYVEYWDDEPQKRPTIDIILERLISMNSNYLGNENNALYEDLRLNFLAKAILLFYNFLWITDNEELGEYTGREYTA